LIESKLLLETRGVRISSTEAIEGCRVLYAIGEIRAASAWHPENTSPLQQDWREQILRELIRKAEDVDADGIIWVGYRNDASIRNDETGVNLKRVVATGMAVKLSCAA
jgi:hypothetical protein